MQQANKTRTGTGCRLYTTAPCFELDLLGMLSLDFSGCLQALVADAEVGVDESFFRWQFGNLRPLINDGYSKKMNSVISNLWMCIFSNYFERMTRSEEGKEQNETKQHNTNTIK